VHYTLDVGKSHMVCEIATARAIIDLSTSFEIMFVHAGGFASL
jgi:hypothetical protein